MAPLTRVEGCFIGIWAESLLYGINFILICSCLYVLIKGKKRGEIGAFLVVIVVFQFLLSTTSAALGVRIMTNVLGSIKSPTVAQSQYSTWDLLEVAKIGVTSVNSILRECILVWRVYRVWDKNWKVTALPVVLLLATSACSIGQIIASARFGLEDIHSPPLTRWTVSFYAASTVANILATVLIAVGVCRAARSFRNHRPTIYRRLLFLVIESGLVYSLVLLLSAVLYLTRNTAFELVYQTLCQFSSIMPAMILLLVGLKVTPAVNYQQCEAQKDIARSEPGHARGEILATACLRQFILPHMPKYDTAFDFEALPYATQDDISAAGTSDRPHEHC